jgi:D-alanyl-D-alanine carboxypeptidase (penicillin-binding protein 5/6)
MSATSRVLAALTLSAAMLLPAQAAIGLPGEDPAPAATGSTEVKTPSGKTATIQMAVRDGAVPAPPVAADSWVLADLGSGQILASLNADLSVRPASTLKLLTALTVAPRLAPEQPYRAVAADEAAEGNRVVLYKGLTYTVADLMNAALMPSANDAAEALARANGGLKVTVEQMNAEAARLGATRTTVKNPSGLDADGQVTTAYDMALIGRAALANSEIADSLLRREVDFPGKVEKGKRVIYPVYNHNRTLVNRRLEGYLGGKSGYTSKAGNTMVAGAEKDGRRLLVTLFHVGGNSYRASEALLQWGFTNADKLSPVGTLADPSAPAPQFDRTILPLPEKGKTPVSRDVAAGTASAADAPTAPIQPRSLSQWLPTIPMPSLPSPLTVLTLLAAVLVALRARVYWIGHRSRTAWTSLDEWATTQARSARRRGPADRRVRSSVPLSGTTDESLIGASQP